PAERSATRLDRLRPDRRGTRQLWRPLRFQSGQSAGRHRPVEPVARGWRNDPVFSVWGAEPQRLHIVELAGAASNDRDCDLSCSRHPGDRHIYRRVSVDPADGRWHRHQSRNQERYLNYYLLAIGSDGYEAIFSLGELDPMFGGTGPPDLIAY